MPVQSEYQRKYKTRSKVETVEDYQVKVGYRSQRRLLEHSHTPLNWDVISEDDDSSGVASIPLEATRVTRHKVDNASTTVSTKKTGLSDVSADPPCPTNAVRVQTESSSCANDKNLPKEGIPASKSNTQVQTDNAGLDKKTSKVMARPKRLKPRVVRRQRSTTGKPNPPLIPYGMAYKNECTDKKRTFNVLAADDVFPSALRAAKRREVEINRKKERKRIESERKLADSLFSCVPQQDDTYMTEYQRNFCNQGMPQKGKSR